MGTSNWSFVSFLLVFLCSLLMQKPTLAAKKSYVVYLGGHSHSLERASLLSNEHVIDSHLELLGSCIGSKAKAQDKIFYSYTRHINGFAANLEEEEATKISRHPSVISVFPNRAHRLHTTHSWDFLRLERDDRIPDESLWQQARFGEDTIIANLDTGTWPESESFNDEGMGPIPSKWKGVCQAGVDKGFHCNRKLIGARYFNKGYKSATGKNKASLNSPRDNNGHGSHTLSTAAGRFVPGVNVFGYGNGTAKGGSPNARIATYKVCWPFVHGEMACFDADILAAFDAAIQDGVDVLSVSIGGSPVNYFDDGVAIGSFHAVKKGITVVCSAGNSGPKPGSVSNTAPWILTVGASTMDRQFPSFVAFNKKHIKGQSLSPIGLPGNKFYPMISSADAKATNASHSEAQLCAPGSLDPSKVRGKIVVCLRGTNARVDKGIVVLKAGGVGMILVNDKSMGNEIETDAHVLPASHVSYSDGLSLFSYLNSTKSAFGYITRPTSILRAGRAPMMAAFSAQGPNTITPGILKPDITAPGVGVLAATGPTYNFLSGTSMSCPHVSGTAGLLKTLHPEWSPAAIRSAIMTTARTRDNTVKPMRNSSFMKATPFSYGSGHVRPNRAMDPGLVYDLTATDYLNFLCAIGYTSKQIATFSLKPYKCPSNPPKPEDLNYPSIAVHSLSGRTTMHRTVKNVGTPGTYKVGVHAPEGTSVTVNPSNLKFDKVGEEKKFEVTVEAQETDADKDYAFGRLIWSDGRHYVRSPIVVKVVKGS